MSGRRPEPADPLRRRGRPSKAVDPAGDRPDGPVLGQPTIRALDQALDMLDAIALRPDLSLSDLARRTGLPNATVHRILQTLGARGMVLRDPAAQSWSLGPGTLRLGAAYLRGPEPAERARPVLQALARETGETAWLGVARGAEVLILCQAQPEQAVRVLLPLGYRAGLHASAIGKAILAALSPAELAAWLAGAALVPATSRTLSDPGALRRDLAATARRGFALDDREMIAGMRAIAAPIRDGAGGVVGGLAIGAPAERLAPGDLAARGAAVMEAAARLSGIAGDQMRHAAP